MPLGDPLEEAARRVHSGEVAAFQAIVDGTSARLVRLAARMLGNLTDAEDVVQEAYVKAYRFLAEGRFDGKASVHTWLYRIVANASVDALRSRSRRPVPTDVLPDVALDGAASAEAHVALAELSDWLEALPAGERAAVVLKAVEGLSSAEVATILGCSEGAVEQRLVRARATLRRRSSGDD
jgi:RNA polymerase sigma-70 factor, ECF subfamily